MNIVTATQQFAVQEHSIFQHSRLEIPNKAAPTQRPVLPVIEQPVSPAQVAEKTSTESTGSAEQNEDALPFNALQSIGVVKRILEQLTSGKLLSWIEGSSADKIAAQQQQNTTSADTAAVTDTADHGSTVLEWNYRYQALSASFSGEAQLQDGSNISWSFEFSLQEEYFSFQSYQQAALKDPLILSLEGTAVALQNTGTVFDFSGKGNNAVLPGLGSGQYYLVHDQNNNGTADHGSELFGPASGQGFAELASLDDNNNGFIENSDTGWQQLGLWDGKSGLKSLAEMGIAAVSTQSVATAFGLYEGNHLLGRIARSGIFLSEQGSAGLVQQVDLNI
ncbi:hypothetical protein [Rheinheimera sp.]|uniref:hypothetical protein n=1 Tax=Rheinheimera sp. TaxID=1869214 RepID=UPI0027BA72AC|nr:hypothetical protein [Rheinheimera sp.]